MSSSNSIPNGKLQYVFGLLGGSLLVGFGLVKLYYSFGYENGEGMANHLSVIGASAFDNIGMLDAANYSIGCIVAGAVVMIALNSVAWKHTNGY